MRDLCEGALRHPSHMVHKLVGFYPLGPAALFIRICLTFMWIKSDVAHRAWLRVSVAGGVWVVAAAIAPLIGYALKWYAHRYMESFRASVTAVRARGILHSTTFAHAARAKAD